MSTSHYKYTYSKEKPLVSVVIPTWNRAHLIMRAANSVLSQTYKNLELIIVDDMSTDNTKEVLSKLHDPRLRYIRLNYKKTDTSYGAARARNAGINASKGSFIAFQDSDDKWLPTKLEKQMNAFQNADTTTGLVYTTLLRKTGSKEAYIPPQNVRHKEGDMRQALLNTNIISLVTAVVRKECLERVGLFDEAMPKYQEWELWLRLTEKYQVKYVNEPLVVSYAQANSISSNSISKITALERLVSKHYDKFAQSKPALANKYFELGKAICSLEPEEFAKGRNYLAKAFSLTPFNCKIVAFLMFAIAGNKVFTCVRTLFKHR